MVQSSAPVQLLVISKTRELVHSLASSLEGRFVFPAIVDVDMYSLENVRAVLKAMNPTPAGMFIGGGITAEAQEDVKKVAEEFNKTNQTNVKIITVPVGIREKLGPEGHFRWIKDTLGKEFGVTY